MSGVSRRRWGILAAVLAVGLCTLVAVLTADNPAGRGYRNLTGFARVDFWLQLLGLALTVAGFWAAFIQIERVKTAAEAARDNSVAGTLRIRYNQLIILLPQLQILEVELDTAIRDDDKQAFGRCLVRWRNTSGQVVGILEKMDTEYDETAESFDKSMETARVLKSKISTSTSPLNKLTAGPRVELSASTDLLARAVGHLSTLVPEREK